MKHTLAIVVFLIAITATTGFLVTCNYNIDKQEKQTAPCYIGVTFCGNTTAEGKMLVDKVKSYTNLFVVDSIVVNKNETALTDLCSYAVAKRLHVIVYFADLNLHWQLNWVNSTKQQLGDWFLGVYYYDEPGGIQLDYNWANSTTSFVPNYSNTTRNYDKAAASFISSFQTYRNFKALKETSVTTFTSDYALYWFDYKAGFDVVLTEFGWNNTLNQEIALSRAAANMENKTWGAIITWKYNQPPYLDTANEIYSQMLLAYQCGAKYITIFNYPTYPDGNPYGLLTDQHFNALQKLWSHITTASTAETKSESIQATTALVLPRNYGWGMRHVDDVIWGFWGPDDLSPQIWNVTSVLLAKYGAYLDIIYDDSTFPFAGKYSQIYYWNDTIYG